MSIEQKLRLLGLGDKESLVYRAALPLESFSISEIAKRSGVKRSMCYVIIDELAKKSLVSFVPGSKKIKYKVESPDIFEKQARQHLSFIEKFVPDLKILQKTGGSSPVIRYFTGKKGVQNILEESLKSGAKTTYYIGASRNIVDSVGEDFMKEFIGRRIKGKQKVQAVRIREHEVNEDIYSEEKGTLRSIRYAPIGVEIDNSILVYNDRVAVISTPDADFGFIIESKEMTKTFLALFSVLWSISSEK